MLSTAEWSQLMLVLTPSVVYVIHLGARGPVYFLNEPKLKDTFVLFFLTCIDVSEIPLHNVDLAFRVPDN
jgi:hypothetical protein